MESIKKFTDVIEQVKRDTYYVETKEDGTVVTDESRKLPVIKFYNTIKLHGTFAGISWDGKNLKSYSKGAVLSIKKDNAGFAQFVENRKSEFIKALDELFKTSLEGVTEFKLMGEFVGKGIQKGVGVNNLPKSYFMFGMMYKHNDNWMWAQVPNTVLALISENIKDVYSIFHYETSTITVDFNNPKEANDKLQKMVERIDLECPVAKAFGFSGHGEGIVSVAYHQGKRYTFKTKGESHTKVVKRNKQKREKDPLQEAKLEFAEKVTPEWRLSQMYNETFDTINGGKGEIKRMGEVIKAVINDVIKEEQLQFKETNFTIKDVQKFISNITRDYVKARLQEEAGL
jgi:hypothetical protein